jgi:hypothetical protein
MIFILTGAFTVSSNEIWVFGAKPMRNLQMKHEAAGLVNAFIYSFDENPRSRKAH